MKITFFSRLILALALAVSGVSSVWAEIEIAHDPIETATSGDRIAMLAEVGDSEHVVEVVRAYFKSADDSRFFYVTMGSDDGETYSTVLPAPKAGVGSIEYFILAKNDNKDIIKSQNFTVVVEDAADSSGQTDGSVERIEFRDVDGYHGRVVRSQGVISVVSANGEKRSLEEAGYVVLESETIETGENSIAAVDFDKDPVTVIDSNSQLKIRKPGFFAHLAGKAYFAFKKVLGVSTKPRFVENLTTTVGIRGTKLISYEGVRKGYALKEGRLAFGESGAQTFQLERDGEVQTKQFFNLEEGNEIIADNGTLRESTLSSESLADFSRLESFAAFLLGGAIIADASSAGRVPVSAEGNLPQQVNGFENGDIALSKSNQPLGATATTGTVTAAVIGGVGTGGLIGIGAGVAALAGGGGGSKSSSDSDDGGDGGSTAQCDGTTTSGGDAPETHVIDLGQSSGTFDVEFYAAGIKDQMQVFYENQLVSDSGCWGAGLTFTDSVSYSGSSNTVRVEIIPNCENPNGTGTFWQFTVNCPL